ncbi:MAG: hypothetical protein ACREQ9_18275, partial [Candidatus Binatia bacterium]
VAVRTAWTICFWPSLIVWQAQTIKEPVVLFLEALALYACVRLKDTLSPRHVIVAALALLALLPFRFYAAYVLGGAMLLGLMLPFARKRATSRIAGLALLACVLPVLIVSGLSAHHQATLENYSLERIESIRKYDLKTSGSSVDINYDVSTPTGKVMTVLAGFGYFVLAPFPWQIASGSARMVFTLPEILAWWWMVFAGLYAGLKYAIGRRLADTRVILLFIGGMVLIQSLTFYNVGLAYRQRSQIIPWVVMLALVGFERKLRAKETSRDVWHARRTRLLAGTSAAQGAESPH